MIERILANIRSTLAAVEDLTDVVVRARLTERLALVAIDLGAASPYGESQKSLLSNDPEIAATSATSATS